MEKHHKIAPDYSRSWILMRLDDVRVCVCADNAFFRHISAKWLGDVPDALRAPTQLYASRDDKCPPEFI